MDSNAIPLHRRYRHRRISRKTDRCAQISYRFRLFGLRSLITTTKNQSAFITHFRPLNEWFLSMTILRAPIYSILFSRPVAARSIPGYTGCRMSRPIAFIKAEYYRSYYVQTGLAEEICYTFYFSNEVAVVISLMRSGDSSRFTAREFKLLKSVAQLVTSLAQRHWQGMHSKFESDPAGLKTGDNHKIIEETGEYPVWFPDYTTRIPGGRSGPGRSFLGCHCQESRNIRRYGTNPPPKYLRKIADFVATGTLLDFLSGDKDGARITIQCS